eukprot:scaffold297470_cov30-Prasinocladus_malaysianus.AAC.1
MFRERGVFPDFMEIIYTLAVFGDAQAAIRFVLVLVGLKTVRMIAVCLLLRSARMDKRSFVFTVTQLYFYGGYGTFQVQRFCLPLADPQSNVFILKTNATHIFLVNLQWTFIQKHYYGMSPCNCTNIPDPTMSEVLNRLHLNDNVLPDRGGL